MNARSEHLLTEDRSLCNTWHADDSATELANGVDAKVQSVAELVIYNF